MKNNFFVWSFLCTILLIINSCTKKKEDLSAQKNKFSLNETTMSRIEIDTVQFLNLSNEVKLTGKIIADENNMVKIFPLVGGQVTYVNAELGDLVSTTKTLAILKSGEVAEYEREQINAKAEYEVAKKNLAIEEELYKSKFSSERDLIGARKAFEQAEAELAKINEILRVYNINANGEYIITSPVAGFIIEKKIGPDLQIRSDMAENMFTVARLDSVFVAMNIYESDVSKIKVGMDAEIHVFSFSDTIYTGKINRILNVLDPESKTMEARVKLNNPGFKLKPDMNCSIRLNFKEDEKMLAVPSTSVIFDKNRHFVMIYHNIDNIETREIAVFRDINGNCFIANGVKEGEKIISKNPLFIYDALND